ncbi:rod shape-determining protein RodA [Echinimonas agarilytica]|uniref:Peptidoglycan glycosyltransferase MrdB n=1 Tax=Echinimonas agarilytica TaxID=1215918 RepID=A0AA41W5Q3_9GAMM|nr:rod shape-determining protein RodA [Echinimonas agarilytica]MCM2679082.1 rod shape-determining protein RodA [Echinimonas agarilytica]
MILGSAEHLESQSHKPSIWFKLHIDAYLLILLIVLMGVGLMVIYSAGGRSMDLEYRQLVRLGLAIFVMIGVAQINPENYRRWAYPIYVLGSLMLVGVLIFGVVGKGAQRWLDLGFMRFQPSEIMKLIVPIAAAHFLASMALPARFGRIVIAFILILIPTLLIARQPDLGTSLLIAASGIFVIFLAGVSWKLIFAGAVAAAGFVPVLWFYLMRDYQRERVLTLFNPERDPLGSGYHIIQSTIAIGSGGMNGKGWLQGTQSQLEFLPERHTDFIFAVFSEEFGLTGVLLLLMLYLLIVLRGLYIAANAQTTFGSLLAGSITLTFFVYVFVNIGMVSGILPVVGVPLPLISYGGTSMVTLLAGFGILMGIHTHRRMII